MDRKFIDLYTYFSENKDAEEYNESGKNGWAKFVSKKDFVNGGERYTYERDEYSYYNEQFIHFMVNLPFCGLENRCDQSTFMEEVSKDLEYWKGF